MQTRDITEIQTRYIAFYSMVPAAIVVRGLGRCGFRPALEAVV